MQQFNPKNEDILIYVNGELLPRKDAKISVLDSVVQGGDAVWEGIRVYDGKIFMLDRHLRRLQDSAKSMAFENVPSNNEITNAVFETLRANNMRDETHIRLTLTRGLKTTSGMDPRLNKFGCGLIVLAEWKPPIYDKKGVAAVTSSIRRNSPLCIDSKIHHNNLINNILAKIEANLLNVDAAIMLDLYGFVAEANGTNLFMIRDGVVHTPTADACLPGITRGLIIELCKTNNIPIVERNISITEFYNADQVFMTGTMGELTPINTIDGRTVGNGETTPTLQNIQQLFKQLTKNSGEPLPF